jgi:hypothetical protein
MAPGRGPAAGDAISPGCRLVEDHDQPLGMVEEIISRRLAEHDHDAASISEAQASSRSASFGRADDMVSTSRVHAFREVEAGSLAAKVLRVTRLAALADR